MKDAYIALTIVIFTVMIIKTIVKAISKAMDNRDPIKQYPDLLYWETGDQCDIGRNSDCSYQGITDNKMLVFKGPYSGNLYQEKISRFIKGHFKNTPGITRKLQNELDSSHYNSFLEEYKNQLKTIPDWERQHLSTKGQQKTQFDNIANISRKP